MSGTADERHAVARREAGRLDERRHQPDLAAPAAVGLVDRDRHLDPVAAPAVKLAAVEQVSGGSRADQQHDPPVPGPVGQRGQHHRAQRRQPDAARHDHEVPPGRGRHVPAGAERAAHADKSARPHGAQRAGDRADRAQRVLQAAGPPAAAVTQAAHRDRHLADAKRGQHRELPRREGRDRAVTFRQLHGDRVTGVLPAGSHPVKAGHRGRWVSKRRHGRLPAGHVSACRISRCLTWAGVAYRSSSRRRVAWSRSVMTGVNKRRAA